MKEKIGESRGKLVVAIGPTVKGETLKITGPAMMFQLLIDFLCSQGWPIHVFDIEESDPSGKERKVGEFYWAKIRHYLCLIPKIWWIVLSRKCCLYLLIGPTLAAFIRDAAVVWPASLFGRRMVFHLFGDYVSFYNKQNPALRLLIRMTLARAEAIIVEGEPVKKKFTFLSNYLTKVIAIPNGLPEKHANFPKQHKTFVEGEDFKLLFLSNMLETKGFWDVLDAVRILVNVRKRKVTCHFFGRFLAAIDSVRFPDPENARDEYMKYIESHNLSGCVFYSESVLGKKKAEVFDSAHVFLLPSNYIYEVQPVSVLEAMAYGAVVISVDHGLISMMVQDNETGYLVPYGSPCAIANKIEYLMDHLDDYELMSKNSIARFQKYFRSDTYCERVATVLEMVSK